MIDGGKLAELLNTQYFLCLAYFKVKVNLHFASQILLM